MKLEDSKNPGYGEIGERIKKEREKAGFSQLELAQKIGKESSTYVALIENGSRKVGIIDLKKIADIFKKPIEYFLDEEEENKKIDYALRAAKKLNEGSQNQIIDFIEFIKKRHDQ
jgi:transcriptional regulator with XRE-family HTH domain